MKRLLVLTLLASPALAEVSFEKGSYFVIHRDYDHKTDTFSDGPPEGEDEACFQITHVEPERIDVELISGTYTPWWSDGEVLEPGFTDSYLNYRDSGFAINRPDADWKDLMRQIWKTVPNCPVEVS